MEVDLKKQYLNRYYKSAEDPYTWFSSGIMNKEVAEFLLRKYNSSYRRLASEANESVLGYQNGKKRRINPYHLTLHKYILMFFGLSLECYFKGYLIKINKLKPIITTKQKLSLSQHITHHNLKKFFTNAFNAPSSVETETLERLQRAIMAGKYPIEKNIEKISSYTAYLNKDIRWTRRMIKKIKNL